jgi:hypothetical protein
MVGHRKRATTIDRAATAFPQQPKQLDARTLQDEISSFALRLAAEARLPSDPDLDPSGACALIESGHQVSTESR